MALRTRCTLRISSRVLIRCNAALQLEVISQADSVELCLTRCVIAHERLLFLVKWFLTDEANAFVVLLVFCTRLTTHKCLDTACIDGDIRRTWIQRQALRQYLSCCNTSRLRSEAIYQFVDVLTIRCVADGQRMTCPRLQRHQSMQLDHLALDRMWRTESFASFEIGHELFGQMIIVRMLPSKLN